MLMLGLFNQYWVIWERGKLGKPKFTSTISLKRLKKKGGWGGAVIEATFSFGHCHVAIIVAPIGIIDINNPV